MKTSQNFAKTKQSTGIKILSIASIIAIVLVFAMLIWNLISNNEFNNIVEKQKNLITNANKFANASSYLTQEVRSYVATSNEKHYNNYMKEIYTDKNRDIAIADMRSSGLTLEEEKIINNIFALSNELVPLEEKAMELAKNEQRNQAMGYVYSEKYQENISEIKVLTSKLLSSVENRTQTILDKHSTIITVSITATFVSLIILGVIQNFIILYVTKYILKPVQSIENNMAQMSEGNLNFTLDVYENGSEIGCLAAAVNKTKENTNIIIDDIKYVLGELADGNFSVKIQNENVYKGDYAPIIESMRTLKAKQNSTFAQIDIVAEEVAQGSEQVSSGAQASAQGATEQASSIDQLSDIITDVADKTEKNNESIASANILAVKAGDEVALSNSKMQEMVESIKEIQVKSNEIANIIKTIEDIAFQTDILAINAAVEAARAGDAGRGFAVVADEVRNLAFKSAEAAKNTTALIEASISSVKKGTVIADETAEKLQNVVISTNDIVKIIKQIAEVSQKQSQMSMEISDGINQISSVVQTNSATAEESAAASEELSGQANMLKSLVKQFRLETDTADTTI